ncbi:MAG: hypothetical protein RLY93_06270 [Sumerlaeia bacterium]
MHLRVIPACVAGGNRPRPYEAVLQADRFDSTQVQVSWSLKVGGKYGSAFGGQIVDPTPRDTGTTFTLAFSAPASLGPVESVSFQARGTTGNRVASVGTGMP